MRREPLRTAQRPAATALSPAGAPGRGVHASPKRCERSWLPRTGTGPTRVVDPDSAVAVGRDPPEPLQEAWRSGQCLHMSKRGKKGGRLGERSRRRRQRRSGERPGRSLPLLLGEMAIIVVILVVPLAINRWSKNLCDTKDVALVAGVSLGLAAWLTASLARGRLTWAQSRLSPLVLAFAAWASLTLIYSRYRFATGLEVMRLAAHVGLYCLVVVSIRGLPQVRRLIGAACLAAVPVCVYGFLQAAGRDPVPWEQSGPRVFSFLGNATYLASFLVLLIPVAAAAAWPHRQQEEAPAKGAAVMPSLPRPGVSALFLGAAAMMLLCLYFTVTLSPTAGLVLGAALALGLVVLRKRSLAFRAGLPLLLAGLVLASGLGLIGYRFLPRQQKRRVQMVLRFKDPDMGMRSLQWRSAWDLFMQNPVLGKGYGTFRIYSLERMATSWYADLKRRPDKMLVPNYAHNELLQVLAGTGLVGGALFLGLLAMGFLVAARVVLREEGDAWRPVALGMIAGSTAFLFQNMFGVTFRQSGAVTFFWLWLGVLAVADACPTTPADDAAAPRIREIRLRRLGPFQLTAAAAVLLVMCAMATHFAMGPARANLAVKRAEHEARLGRYERAAEYADDAIRSWPYSEVAYYIAAYAWGQLGQYDKALAANRKALELLPGNASVYYNLGVTYKEMGRLEEAEESFAKAIELQPTAVAHQAAMAELLFKQERFDEAYSHARAALRLDRKEPRTRLLLADIEIRRGNMSEAMLYLKRAAKLSPDDVNIWRDMAQLAMRAPRHDIAISAAHEWIRLDPNSASAYGLLGVCYYETKSFGKAERALKRALELDPTYLHARLTLAYTYGRTGRREQAQQELRRVVREGPNTGWGRAAQRTLQDLRTARRRQRQR